MRNLLARRESPRAILHARLENAWYVEADWFYSVVRRREQPENAFVVLRTLTGAGQVVTCGGKTYELKANSLLIMRNEDILSHAASHDGWRFYRFDFLMDGEPARLGELISLHVSERERTELERCFISLGSSGMCELALAETLFNYMLADWMLRAENEDAGGMLQQQIISLLERGRREKLSVAEMAREAGMCERSFRDAAHAATGLAPKAFMLKGEMNAAMELLLTSSMSISEISACFNYSSQFYFSRVFKKYYGVSPQQARSGNAP